MLNVRWKSWVVNGFSLSLPASVGQIRTLHKSDLPEGSERTSMCFQISCLPSVSISELSRAQNWPEKCLRRTGASSYFQWGSVGQAYFGRSTHMVLSPCMGAMMRTLPLRCSFGAFDNLLKSVIFHMILISPFCYAKNPLFFYAKTIFYLHRWY
jgi:hypothetical protein